MVLPKHIAIIMDGNGRWAQSKGLPRVAGHQQGVVTVKDTVQECSKLGIEYLTLYAFSSENWSRPEGEVEALMGLLGQYLASELALLQEHRIRFHVIGDLSKLPKKIGESLSHSMAVTSTNTGMTLTLALSYGSRNEIVRAVKRLSADDQSGQIDLSQLTEKQFSDYLDTAPLPDPDLLIRTSGEMRISNFLLWQLAYTELYFCSCYWPEFDASQLRAALEDYSRRCRRFGGVSSALSAKQLQDESLEEASH
ncbi:MAG: isoprenyl transferase [Desulfobacteraceae bacterium 4572_35.2]|nr:MAG: isoprenyl transferase [Desulfobacteraceae bacterium 4572_35.2]